MPQVACRVQEYGSVWVGSPPLDPEYFTSCYGAQLKGYVQVEPPTITVRHLPPLTRSCRCAAAPQYFQP